MTAPERTSETVSAGRLASNFVWLGLAQLFARGTALVAGIYLARKLGPDMFGLFSVAQALVLAIWPCIDLTTNLYAVREIARARERFAEIARPLYSARLLGGIVASLVMMAVVWTMELPSVERLAYLGAAVYLAGYATYTDWLLKGMERFSTIALGSFVTGVVFVLVLLLGVHEPGDLPLATLGWSLSFLAGGAVLLLASARHLGWWFRPDLRVVVWRSHLEESVYFTASAIFLVGFRFGPILALEATRGKTEVGFLGAPYGLVYVSLGVAMLAGQAVYPTLARLFQSSLPAFRRTSLTFAGVLGAAGLAGGLILAPLAGPVVAFVFGPEFTPSGPVLAVLALALPLALVRVAVGLSLTAAGRQRQHNVGTFAAAVVATGGTFAMAADGATGAATAVVAGEAVMLLSFLVSYRGALRGQPGSDAPAA